MTNQSGENPGSSDTVRSDIEARFARMKLWLEMREDGPLPDVLHEQWKRELAELEALILASRPHT